MMMLAVHFVRVVIVRTAHGVAPPNRTATNMASLAGGSIRCNRCRCQYNLGTARFTAAATVVTTACVTVTGYRTATTAATRCCRCRRCTGRLGRYRCVVYLTPPVNVFVRFFVLGKGETGTQTNDGAPNTSTPVMVVAACAVVVVEVVADVLLLLLLMLAAVCCERCLGRMRHRQTVMGAAAVAPFGRFVVQRE